MSRRLVRLGVLTATLAMAACAPPARIRLAGVSAARQPEPEILSPVHKGHIDLATGVYVREDDDLIVRAPFPLVLRRTHLSGDSEARRFGRGGTHDGEWWLYGNGDPRVPWAELILSDGARVHFDRVSPGETQVGAVLEHPDADGEWAGATLRWDGRRWILHLRSGEGAAFFDCPPNDCSVDTRWDARDNRVEYHRDAKGVLLEMRSAGRAIRFDYDERSRVRAARTSSGQTVTYAYDDRGRLRRSVAADGAVRTYVYNDLDELIEVHDPERTVVNVFGEGHRVTRQTVTFAGDPERYEMTFAYTVVDGVVIRTEVTDNDGSRTVYRFDEHHRPVSTSHEGAGLVARAAAPVGNIR